MIILENFPVVVFGRRRPQTTSKGFGISIFSFGAWNLFPLTVIAAPPPRFTPGLAVEK